MDWRPYGACCAKYSADPAVAFCPDCRHPLVRCMAVAECRSLVPATGPCPACVAPQLLVDAGAVVQSKAGERLAVPLILRNQSPAGRTIWVKRLARLDGAEAAPVALTWEQIDAGAERRVVVDTPPLEAGGTYALRVVFVVGSRYRGLEEEFAFTAGTTIRVASEGPHTFTQVINVDGVSTQGGGVSTGGAVSAPVTVDFGDRAASTALLERMALPLDRAERYELEAGVRGYREQRARASRLVAFSFEGFHAAECPPDGATLADRGLLAFGRNGRSTGARDAAPNDVCLRAYGARAGVVDEPATLAISRHHFDLVVVNDRVCLLARTTRGLQVNEQDLAAGQLVPLASGDRIIPIPGRPDKLCLHVDLSTSMGVVDRVRLRRAPVTPS
ncbi:MAG: hypothetical protein IT181_11495 [Acidobacteria bacterium]|nr:hypothetical protein [Acidobacteriota bacterium]